MTVYEMRKQLVDYCNGKQCYDCKLCGNVCRCGNGVHFMNQDCEGNFAMSDEEIEDAYKIVFGKPTITPDEERSITTLIAGKKLVEAVEKDSLSSLMEALEYATQLSED